MKKLILLFLFSSFLLAQPSWVNKRPNAVGYYHGIGVVPVSEVTQDYTQRAKDIVLNDIAQQIIVSIDATQLRKISEQLGNLQEEFESAVQTSTKADIEGVEVVDTWQGNGQYWVYYRLNIGEYEHKQAEKLRKATALGLDFYSKGKTAEKKNSLSDALQFFMQALSSVEKFINEPLEGDYNGKKIFLTNEIFSSIQSLLNRVELKAKNPKLNAQVGKPLRIPLEVDVTNIVTQQPIQNFSIKYSFIRGNGDIVPLSKSNKNGIAVTQVVRIISTEKLQLVRAETNVAGMLSENASPLLKMLSKSFRVPDTRFTINVAPLAIILETEEILFGRKLKLPRIEPLLKSSLSSNGFTFVDDSAKANLNITIKSNGRTSGEFQGLYSVYVDANISVTDLNSGEEIYKTSFNNVKGVSINYDKAGMKAYDEIAEKLQKEIIPKILEQIKK